MPYDIRIASYFDPKKYGLNYKDLKYSIKYIIEFGNNDIQFNEYNKFDLVEGVDKLIQNVIVSLCSELSKNLEDPNYGSYLTKLIGQKIDSNFLYLLNKTLISTLEYYNILNADNPNDDEIIDTIEEASININENDPRIIVINISLRVKSGKLSQFGIALNPEVV